MTEHMGRPGIRAKLFVVFLGLLFVPFALYTTMVLYQSAREARGFATISASQVMDQTTQFLETRLGTVKRALDLMSLGDPARKAFAGTPERYEDNLGQWMVDAEVLQKTSWALSQNNPDIRKFTLYTLSGLAAFSENMHFRRMENLQTNSWYLYWKASPRAFLWVPDYQFVPDLQERMITGNERRIYGFRKIFDEMDLRRTIGIMRVDIPLSLLESLMSRAESSPFTSLFLLDGRRQVVAASRLGSSVPKPLRDLILANPAFDPEPPKTGETLGESMGFTVLSRPVEGTDWQLVMLVPAKDMNRFAERLSKPLWLLFLALGGLMLPLSYLVASTSTRRIAQLALGVRQISRGDFDHRVPESGTDEIGELTRSFNTMAGRVRELLDHEYRMGQEMKNLEMLALQAQINPHFLYNTLDLVNCLALQARVPLIAEAVTTLSRFYRLSLGGGADRVRIGDELEHVAAYVHIQNMRFGQTITLICRVPDAVLDLPIHKITLQPLVENAILHGIRESDREEGTIHIRAVLQDGWVSISVADDGAGFDPATVEPLLQGLPHSNRDHGYGVGNLQRRLKVAHGDQAGLSFTQTPGGGTTVTIRFPAGDQELPGST